MVTIAVITIDTPDHLTDRYARLEGLWLKSKIGHLHFHKESGYHSLVALVLAMQADAFVITSGSNWSRLMEELCLGKDMEPRCAMVDVTPWRPHDW